MLDLDFHDKTVVVSGSTAGIGLACVMEFAGYGAHVVVNGRTQKRVDTAVAAVKERYPDAKLTGVAADLSTAAGVGALLARIPSTDVLVNNLSIFEPRDFLEIDDAAWLRFFETNVMSGIRLGRAYIPGMRAKNWGRIVFVSSESGLHIPVEMIHYGVTKTAQIALARGLAESLEGTGVTVNSVLPGPTYSEGVGTFVAQLAEKSNVSQEEFERRFFEEMRPTSLIKRFLTTGEVANMVLYVCSPAASGTTGAALRVDGGVVRAIP